MAKLFPDIDKTRVIFASQAEEQFYLACKEQLDDQWCFFSSCNLSIMERDSGMKDNEMDAVIYHPRHGVLCIEVKGGRIEYRAESGEFFSINRHSQRFKIKDPFKQVLVWKSRFIRHIRQKSINVPVSHAVCFPRVNENDFPESAAMEKKLIIGLSAMKNLDASLSRLMKSSHAERFFNFSDVEDKIIQVLRGKNFHTKKRLRVYLDNHELRVKDIETITETLITPIASSLRLGIEGEAGTGKTMLAVMLARHFSQENLKVLLLSNNSLMNSSLQNECGQQVSVKTYTELAADYGVDLTKTPKNFEGSIEDWIQVEGPVQLAHAIETKPRTFDVLLCDEAQDVQPFWWEAFEGLLKNKENSHFYLFFDSSQGVFGSGSSEHHFVAEDVLPIPGPYFPLVHNYRTTREISGFSRHFRTGRAVLQSHCGRLGYKPELIFYNNKQKFLGQLKNLLKMLIEEEGIRPHEITILSARAPFKNGSTLEGVDKIGNYSLLDLSHPSRKRKMPSTKQQKGKIKVSTIPLYKGLETPIAIITNLSEYNLSLSNPIMSSLFYVACTRAKHMLYVCLQETGEKTENIQEALASLRQSGSMVLEGSHADTVFMGRVTHYNAHRVGLLEVDDPAFQKDSVMFFPNDLKNAGINELRVGDILSFRPQAEGGLMVAGDLKLGE